MKVQTFYFDEKSRSLYLEPDEHFAKLNSSEAAIILSFLNAPDCVLSKEELVNVGWPGRVVGPNSLTMSIKRIREALRDNGTIIETIPRKGYMLHAGFIELVQQEQDTLEVIDSMSTPRESSLQEAVIEPEQTKEKSEVLPRRKSYRLAYSIFLCVSLLLVTIVGYNLSTHKPEVVCLSHAETTVCSTVDAMPEIEGIEPGRYLYGFEYGDTNAKYIKIE